MAVILLDVEGEYTELYKPTSNPDMLAALRERKLTPIGVPSDKMTLYHLVGRETANPDHPDLRQFSLQFARMSPYTVAEILGLTEPQEQRFMQAYSIAKEVLRDLGIFPAKGNGEQERLAMEIDEFERGYPRLSLSMMMDVVAACLKAVESKKEKGSETDTRAEFTPWNDKFATPEGKNTLRKRIYGGARLDSAVSWGDSTAVSLG
jgi:hypothetical protein